MAERQQADVADQQVEGAGEQGEAQGLHDEERIGDERRHGERRRQDDERDGELPRLARGGAAWARRSGSRSSQATLPNRPAGLISSTTAMMTKTTVLEASG